MSTPVFPLEKIFGSRTRIKVITLYTTGIKRPYYVREIARAINERLNAVRRELEILRKVGMLTTYHEKRKKFYRLNSDFVLLDELSSIMQKVGPGIQDVLFKDIDRLGNVLYACASGYFTGAKNSPTDLLIIGSIDEKRLNEFIENIQSTLNREIIYTPMNENEYRYRRNFHDMFLKQIFMGPYKELVNKLEPQLQPTEPVSAPGSAAIIRAKG